jgi:K(+)-stimulated pyrophosphate-energized sodium pump
MTELALTFALCVLGLTFAAYLARWVLARPDGEGDLVDLGALIRAAAEGFSRRLHRTIGAVAAALGGTIFLAYGLLRGAKEVDPVPPLQLGVWLTASFAVGVASALLVARTSVWASTHTAPRTADAARKSVDRALQVALRGGAIAALLGNAVGLFGVAALFLAVLAYKGALGADASQALAIVPTIPIMISGYALGAAFSALLAQLASGVFAKGADLGADLGARTIGRGDDDVDNPAALVDLAGDSVNGASRAVGAFAANAVETLAAMMAGAEVYRANESMRSAVAVTLFPVVVRAFGLVASMFGVMVVRTDDREDPLSALARGLYVASLLLAVGAAGAAKWLLEDRWVGFFACTVLGVVLGVLLFHATQYATEHRYRGVRDIAEGSRVGPTMTTLQGLASAFESTVPPFAAIGVVAVASYAIGARSGLAFGGLYGMAAATIGLLGTSGYVLAIDGLGPIADEAAGLVEMTIGSERRDVRGRAAVLDAVGNTTKSIAKAFSASSAALSSLLLPVAFVAEIERRGAMKPGGHALLPLDRPEIYVAALAGLLLVAWVAARCLSAVARAARRVLDEVKRAGPIAPLPTDRRRPIPRSRENSAPSERQGHGLLLEILTRASLREMLVPAAVSVVVPIALGLGLRFAKPGDNARLAAEAVAAFVMAGTIAGVLGSLLLGNAGGAWDNAKKYIATGAHGGRYLVDESGARIESPTYLAALVGDTLGDPLKDAASPTMQVLVKMLPIVMLVFLPFFL